MCLIKNSRSNRRADAFFFNLLFQFSHTCTYLFPYTIWIFTPPATNDLLKSLNVLPLSGISIIVWWGMIFLPFHNEEHACWPDADFYESCQRTALRNSIHWLSAGCVGGGTCNLRFTPLWLQGHNLSVQINSTMACLDFHMPDRWRIFGCVSRKP